MTVRTWETPAEQMRRGVSADRIRCEEPGCPGVWDGEAALSGRPVCAAHRTANTRELLPGARIVHRDLRDLAATEAAQPA